MEPKFHVLRTFIENADFAKNYRFSLGELLFFQPGTLINQLKMDTKTTSQKTLKKSIQKSSFGIHVGFPKPRQTIRNATQNEACFATLCKSPGSRQKPSEGMVCKPSK